MIRALDSSMQSDTGAGRLCGMPGSKNGGEDEHF